LSNFDNFSENLFTPKHFQEAIFSHYSKEKSRFFHIFPVIFRDFLTFFQIKKQTKKTLIPFLTTIKIA